MYNNYVVVDISKFVWFVDIIKKKPTLFSFKYKVDCLLIDEHPLTLDLFSNNILVISCKNIQISDCNNTDKLIVDTELTVQEDHVYVAIIIF